MYSTASIKNNAGSSKAGDKIKEGGDLCDFGDEVNCCCKPGHGPWVPMVFMRGKEISCASCCFT